MKVVSDEEVKKALFDMAPLKALGSDGFHAFFFQNQRDVVGNDICKWVKRIFDRGTINLYLNNTLIVLIPKVHNLGMYLGVPLFHEKVTNSTLRFAVDKVRNHVDP
ncbi:hypothetical protein J1N35_040264 [Gossypium stocksii]|uniref:DUF4283 domain-containing protein n=1 Tax=Gossypium stocksii TaxID=47602 RepID=A0A9D3UDH6_9ROSI|nr:hypothetical protein J1N35_040264 [Gossypium stocksii]